MHRAAICVVVVAGVASGCGSAPPPPVMGPGTATSPTPRNAASADATADQDGDEIAPHHQADYEPCEATIEAHAPGNHDRFSFEDPATGLVGFKNGAGVVVIKPTYRFAYQFGPGGVAAAVDGTTPFVFIDPAGKVLARAYAFDNGPDYFQDGLARIVGAGDRIGFIDDHGRIVIAPRFDAAAGFCHGQAEVTEAGRTFVIDRAGKTVAP